MKRAWEMASVEVVSLNKTAFGPYNPENPDSEKTAVKNDDGVIVGWEQEFGEKLS